MSDLQAVVAEEDERAVVAVSVHHPTAAAIALAIVQPGDFWLPAHERIMTSLLRMPTGTTLAELDQRAAIAAGAAGWTIETIWQLVDEAPTMTLIQPWARRVAAAARARRTQRVCLDAARQLGEGADLAQVLDEILRAAA